MRVLSIVSVLLLCSTSLSAQKKLVSFYSNQLSKERLKSHLEIIAGDSLMGRETGTEGQRMAAEYIENHFKSLELKPAFGESYQQEFNIDLIKPADVSLASAEHQYQFPENLIYLGSVNTQGFKFSDIVYVGYGIDDSIYSDYANVDVQGKVVLFKSGEPKTESGDFELTGSSSPSIWSRNPAYKIRTARANGALLAIEVNPDFDLMKSRYQRFLMRTRVSLAEQTKEDEAAYIIVGNAFVEDVCKIKNLDGLEAGSVINVDEMLFKYTSNSEPGISSNVGAVLQGAKYPNEYLVITAHYDHLGVRDSLVFNGADDDGSGTVSVMELAEAFSLAAYEGHKPDRSILFLLVSGEEKGLLGSEYFTEHAPMPLENIMANLNIDMVGRVDKQHVQNPNYVYVIGSEMLSEELKKINEKANKESVKIALDYRYDDPDDPNRFYYRSDHYNFAKNNIPVAFFFNGTHDDYHQASDTVEKINFDKMLKINKLIFTTSWKLANKKEFLKMNEEK